MTAPRPKRIDADGINQQPQPAKVAYLRIIRHTDHGHDRLADYATRVLEHHAGRQLPASPRCPNCGGHILTITETGEHWCAERCTSRPDAAHADTTERLAA